MNFITSEKMCNVSPNIGKELAAWVKECDVLGEYDLVELFYEFTEDVIKKNNLDMEPKFISRIMLYKDTSEEVSFLNNIGVTEFRIVPLFSESHLRDYIEYRMDGRLGITPIDKGYNFFIVKDGDDIISTEWTLEGNSIIELLWHIVCMVSII